MVSNNKSLTIIIILLLLSVLFSGCIEEKKIVQPDSIQKDAVEVSSSNLTRSSIEENMPEISVTSFSSIYMHNNYNNSEQEIYLFSWEDVPGNDSYRLLSFLRDYHQVNLVENAQIIKYNGNNTIHVLSDENLVEITFKNDSVLMKISKDKIYYLWDSFNYLKVKEENGTHNFYDFKTIIHYNYDFSERYYSAYNLSIKNNGSNPIDFKMNDLRLHEGDRIFNTTTLEHYDGPNQIEVLHDLENENKLQDTTLLPGQTLNGIVAFRVNSLYNKSFLLKFNTMTVTSASFEKSIEALRIAEGFNYATALGITSVCQYTSTGGLGRLLCTLF